MGVKYVNKMQTINTYFESFQNGPLPFGKLTYICAWIIRETVFVYTFFEAILNVRQIKWGKRTYRLSNFGRSMDVVHNKDTYQIVWEDEKPCGLKAKGLLLFQCVIMNRSKGKGLCTCVFWSDTSDCYCWYEKSSKSANIVQELAPLPKTCPV